MKKFLSIFVALAMVLSLFAGVGARLAKAADTLTVTCIDHNETAKTITYLFSVPVELERDGGYTFVTPDKLDIYVVDSLGNYHDPASVPPGLDTRAPGVTVTSATFDAAGTTLTVTYTGSLVTGTRYVVDAWGYTIVNLGGAPFTSSTTTNITFTVAGALHTLLSIVLVPATVTLAGSAQQVFTATAMYSDATTATVTATYTATLGTFSGSTYTAPAATVATQTATVTGTYTEGAVTKLATAVVTISAIPVTNLQALKALKALYKQIGDTAKLIRDKVKAAKAAGKDLTGLTADLKTAQKYATHRAVSHGIMLTEVERAMLETMQTSIHKLEQDLKTLRKIKTPKATKATLDLFRAQIKTAIAARTAYLKTIHTAALTQYSSRLVTLIADATMKLTFLQTLLGKL